MVLYSRMHRECLSHRHVLLFLLPTNICKQAGVDGKAWLTITGNASRWWQVQAKTAKDPRLDRDIPLFDWPGCLPHWHELGRLGVPMG